MSAVVRRRVVVRGRVQGVFFRDTTRRRAEQLGVAGWARNRGDGSVEAVFEGEADAVEAMLQFVRQGPGRAVVSEVETHEEEPTGEAGSGSADGAFANRSWSFRFVAWGLSERYSLPWGWACWWSRS